MKTKMNQKSILFSVIAPVFNEVESLAEFYKQIKKVMSSTKRNWELLLIDDGSTDGSTDAIHELAAKDPHVQPIIFARNFGHQIAVTAGLDYAHGDAVVIIDADLQDPPEVILELIKKWKEGYQVVYAVRRKREGENWFKLFSASLFYRIIYHITDVKIPLDTGDFRLVDRRVVNVMRTMREHHRFLRGMSAWVGFKQIGVEYDRRARFAGKTKYPFRKMLKLAMNAIASFSFFPLQLATYFGFFCAGFGILAILVIAIVCLSRHEVFWGHSTTLSVFLFFGGIQLIFIGIIGEYLGRIYDEVKGRPLYILSEDPSEEQKK